MQELLAVVDLEYLLGRYGPQKAVSWAEVSQWEPGTRSRQVLTDTSLLVCVSCHSDYQRDEIGWRK
jgi:hypothetical protein